MTAVVTADREAGMGVCTAVAAAAAAAIGVTTSSIPQQLLRTKLMSIDLVGALVLV
jgi:hypothetical protein